MCFFRSCHPFAAENELAMELTRRVSPYINQEETPYMDQKDVPYMNQEDTITDITDISKQQGPADIAEGTDIREGTATETAQPSPSPSIASIVDFTPQNSMA